MQCYIRLLLYYQIITWYGTSTMQFQHNAYPLPLSSFLRNTLLAATSFALMETSILSALKSLTNLVTVLLLPFWNVIQCCGEISSECGRVN